MRIRSTIFVLLLAASSVARAEQAREESAAQVFAKLYPKGAPSKRRHLAGHPEAQITVGYEGEYFPDRVPQLEQWYGRDGKRTDKAPTLLEERLHTEPKRNELLTKPLATLEQAFALQDAVVAHTGLNERGDSPLWWQSNVAYPRVPAFTQKHERGIEGYVNFSADYAVFYKLHKGHEIGEKNDAYLPGTHFMHPHLGPLTTRQQQDIRNEIKASKRGENSGSTAHYLQGTYYRTSSYNGDGVDRDGFEQRDPHHELTILERELRRNVGALEHGFDDYKAFSKLRGLDTSRMSGQFTELPESAQHLIRGIKVRNLHGSIVPLYWERYGLPLRPIEEDYSQALRLGKVEANAFRARVTKARTNYVETLKALARDSSLDNKQQLFGLHRALARFAYETQLYPLLDRYAAKVGRRYLRLRQKGPARSRR